MAELLFGIARRDIQIDADSTFSLDPRCHMVQGAGVHSPD